MTEGTALSGPLDRLEGHAAGNEVLGDVALMLREISSTLHELREQVAGRVKELYTVEEVGEMTGRAPYTVRSWVREGTIHAERLAGTGPKGRLMITRSEVEKLIRAGKGQAVVALTASKCPLAS